jgi:hypothetical protein
MAAYVGSVLAPRFPKFLAIVNDVNRAGAEEEGSARKKTERLQFSRRARGASIASAPALPVSMASPWGTQSALHGGEA